MILGKKYKKYKNIDLISITVPITVPTSATVPATASIKLNQLSSEQPVGIVGWWNGPLSQHKVGETLKQFEQFMK